MNGHCHATATSPQAPVPCVQGTSWVLGPVWMDRYGEEKLYCPHQGSNPGLSQHVAKNTKFSDPLLRTNSISKDSSYVRNKPQVLQTARAVIVEMYTALQLKFEGRYMIYFHTKFISFSIYHHQTQHYIQISQSHHVRFQILPRKLPKQNLHTFLKFHYHTIFRTPN